MAFKVSGFRSFDYMGSVDGSAGSNRQLHSYVTNDDAAAVETNEYFIDLKDRLQVGDLIFCSLDLDGTPAARFYVVNTVSSTQVRITRGQATAAV